VLNVALVKQQQLGKWFPGDSQVLGKARWPEAAFPLKRWDWEEKSWLHGIYS